MNMTIEEKAKAYDEAMNKIKPLYEQAKKDDNPIWSTYEHLFPQLRESEDERIRKWLIKTMKGLCNSPVEIDGSYEMMLPAIDWLKKQKESVDYANEEYWRGYREGKQEILNKYAEFEKQKEQKPIKMEVYEVGKGTTICGQNYKCKKDYKEGNCWYIKDVIYHCSRDGYLTDQNGISWSCTPKWFKEYIYHYDARRI